MAKSVFDLKSLHKVRGLAESFEAALKQCVHDCKQRPGLRQARSVEIKIVCKPSTSDPEDVVVETDVKCKIPNRSAEVYKMQSTVNDGLKFQPDAPFEPDQETLDFDDE